MSLAIFDLDNTLIADDSDHLWGMFLCEEGVVDANEYSKRNDEFFSNYHDGSLDIYAYQKFVLRPLAVMPLAKLEELRFNFISKKIDQIILKKGKDLIEEHVNNGDHPIIITATNDFVARPIATLLGIEDLLACTAEFKDGSYTGEILGTPTFKEGKVSRLKEWTKQNRKNLKGAWFYSDSHNDLPLLEFVDNPVAVDPDTVLKDIASNRGWKIISLRN